MAPADATTLTVCPSALRPWLHLRQLMHDGVALGALQSGKAGSLLLGRQSAGCKACSHQAWEVGPQEGACVAAEHLQGSRERQVLAGSHVDCFGHSGTPGARGLRTLSMATSYCCSTTFWSTGAICRHHAATRSGVAAQGWKQLGSSPGNGWPAPVPSCHLCPGQGERPLHLPAAISHGQVVALSSAPADVLLQLMYRTTHLRGRARQRHRFENCLK